MLVGDAAYPMLPYLMRPYCGANLTAEQECFNLHHSRVRITVENAFGRLKARWRILKRQLDVDIERAPVVIGACCILHNLCEMSATPMPRESEDTRMQPIRQVSLNLRDSSSDTQVRQTIAEHLYRRHNY